MPHPLSERNPVNSRQRVLSATISAGLLVALTACSTPGPEQGSSERHETVSVTSCGLDIEFENPPTRAVTLQQAATEVMLALGLQESMAGTSNLIGAIPEEYRAAYGEVPVLGPDGKVPSQEDLLAVNPDFLYSTYGSIFTADQVGTREELLSLGAPSYLTAFDCQESAAEPVAMTFERLFDEYRTIGAIFGVGDRAESLAADQQKVVSQAMGTAERLSEVPNVLWFYSTYSGAPYIAGAGGVPDEINRITGTKNAFAELTSSAWPEVTWESIIEADPDVIVVADLSARGLKGDSAAEKIELLKSDPASAQLDAVRNDRFIVIDGVALDPSVRNSAALNTFIRGLETLGYLG